VESPTHKRLLSRLRQLRKRHDLTQEQFAELSGISYKYYQAVEGGRKTELRLSTVERLAVAYGIEAWQMLSPTMPRTRAPKLKGTTKSRKPSN